MQVLLGLSSVVAPATQVGKGAVLAGMASAEAGTDLAPQMLYLGSPAAAMFKSPVRLGVRRVATLLVPAQIMRVMCGRNEELA